MLNVERRLKPATGIPPSNIAAFPNGQGGGASSGEGSRQRAAFEPASLFWKVTAHGTRPGRPRGLLLAWPRWERFAHSLWPTQRIPGSVQDLLQVRIVPYHGESLTLPDGSEIQTGMIVGELHCNNQAILELVRNRGNPYRAMREELRSLARWISQPGFDINVEAFFGITLIANAAVRIGFSMRARPLNLRLRLDRMFMTGLLLLYTIDGLARIDKGTTSHSYPREVWLSRRELIRRYGNRGVLSAGFPSSRPLAS